MTTDQQEMKTETSEITPCGEQRRWFGAPYEDGICIDGYMWDLDSGDGSGSLTSVSPEPCPNCNHDAFLALHEDGFVEDGYTAAEQGKPRQYAHTLIICEKEGDAAKIEAWWLKGYDEYVAEARKEAADV